MQRARFRRSHRWFALLMVLVVGTATHATRLRALNLEELTKKAGRIVQGRCIDVEVMDDPVLRRSVTIVTLEVDRTLKGSTERTQTFRLLGAIGVPRFEIGDSLVLFLYPDSRAGLTSPVGLGQGRFLELRDKNGRTLALNGFGTTTLFDRLSEEATARIGDRIGAWANQPGVPPDVLVDMIRSLERHPGLGDGQKDGADR